jgi:NAD(P)H-dependent FMN reductase
MIHLQVIVGSVRKKRHGPVIATWAAGVIGRDPRFAVEIVDLAEVALPVLDEPHHPRHEKYEHAHTRRWSAIAARADAFVVVTPEYNHSAPAAIKNAIDYLHNEWRHKPIAFVSYGGVSGGTRAVAALRPVATAVKMFPVTELVAIPFFDKLIVDGRFVAPPGLEESFAPMLDSIAFLVDKLGAHGKRSG